MVDVFTKVLEQQPDGGDLKLVAARPLVTL